MFYKYSNYSSDQIINESYQKICDELLSVVKDGQTKEKMKSILYEGGYGEFSVNCDMTKNNPGIERKKRISFAYILATHPETFDIMSKYNVNLFHGTNSNALPNILKYGMKSVDDLSEIGIEASTGEEWSRIGGKRNFISFTDDIDTSLDYASMHLSNDGAKDGPFGVLIGISAQDTKNMKTSRVRSDLPEVGIMNNVPLEYIKFIAVPESKVNFVRKLVNDDNIMVMPLEIDERSYQIDLDCGEMFFDVEKTKELIEGKKQDEPTFNSESVEKLAKGRKLSGIKGIFEKLRQFKEKFNSKGKNNERDSRDK